MLLVTIFFADKETRLEKTMTCPTSQAAKLGSAARGPPLPCSQDCPHTDKSYTLAFALDTFSAYPKYKLLDWQILNSAVSYFTFLFMKRTDS